MKLMVVAPLWLPIPPAGYGGIERVVYNVVNGLVDKGHHVTLYAPGGTQTKAQKLVSVYPRPLREDDISWTDVNYNLMSTAKAIKQAEQENFDAILFSVERPYYLSPISLSKVPTLFTTHGTWTYETQSKNEVDMIMAFKDQNFISISHAQQQEMPELNFIANVYNGLDIEAHTFRPEGKGYAVWIGRFEEEKGAHLAIQVAKSVGIPIKLAGPIRNEQLASGQSTAKTYFEQQIKPFLSDQVELVGEVEHEEKDELLGNASVLINPYVYKEPFGYVTLEALACGTPVVVPPWGAGPEIIEAGVSGFIGSNIKEWTEATKKAMTLNRGDCRERAWKFDTKCMVEGYEQALQKIIKS